MGEPPRRSCAFILAGAANEQGATATAGAKPSSVILVDTFLIPLNKNVERMANMGNGTANMGNGTPNKGACSPRTRR